MGGMWRGILISTIVTAIVWAQSVPRENLLQFRIAVGLTDTEPKEWIGRITAPGAQIAALTGWRFSQKDHASVDGEFSFRTKIGNLENQLRTDFPYGQTDWNDPNIRRLIPQGLIVRLDTSEFTRIRFESTSGTFGFGVDDIPLHRPAEFLGGNARVERMPVAINLSEPGFADDHPAIAIAPDRKPWFAWLTHQDDADFVTVSDGTRPIRITEKGDHQGPTIAATPNGWIHAAWSQREGSEFQIYMSTRALGRWTTARRMSSPGASHLSPRLASDARGHLALVWQALRNGQSAILARVFDDRTWSAESPISEGSGNAWTPSLGFGGGKLWFAWDSYNTGAYQIYAREVGGGVQRVTIGESFSVRPTIAVNAQGVPIVAWEESDPLWGKDFAFLTDRRGTTLYRNRRIRAAMLDGAAWKELPGDVAHSIPLDQRRFLQQPQLALDGSGRLHLAFRARTSAATARIDYWASGGRWESFITRLEGDQWIPAAPMSSSTGRNGMRVALAASPDRLYAAWSTDQRPWPQGRYGDLEVLHSSLPLTGAPSNFRGLRPLTLLAAPQQPHPTEAEDVERIRAHRIRLNGKTYRILRGDLHRHTELSGDGSGDGSLEDLYRYNLDAAAMDYAHVADHQMGNDELYNWWITQKSSDLYYMPQRFVPLYGYERSVRYPNGHRNIIWAERGKPVLPIREPEASGRVNTGPVLFPYLQATNGIATSHTSATEQGTDWRDNDPSAEPIVEIYQGFESSYEHEGAPRAWKPGDKAVHQGMRPAGLVWNAWAKGYKLGVQASSDHVSTHSSFACVLVEEFTRAGLLDAMRKRHTYAATDAIIVDFKAATSSGVALMGDATTSSTTPKLIVKVMGTAPIQQIDLIKNNTYIHKLSPGGKDASFEYVDASLGEGESFYYIRVQQTDGQLAWSSPVWIKKTP